MWEKGKWLGCVLSVYRPSHWLRRVLGVTSTVVCVVAGKRLRPVSLYNGGSLGDSAEVSANSPQDVPLLHELICTKLSRERKNVVKESKVWLHSAHELVFGWRANQRHLMKSSKWHMGQFGCNNPWTFEHLVPKWDIHYWKKVKLRLAKQHTVKQWRNLHWQNTFTCWILFILETVINDIHRKSFSSLILHLGSELFIFCCCKSNIPLSSQTFPTLDFKMNKLIDWLMDTGQGVLMWTVWIRKASTVVGDKVSSLQKPQQVACVWVVH